MTEQKAKTVKLGPWQVPPMTLQTIIALQEIGSPFYSPPVDKDGKVIEDYQPTFLEIAEALYVMKEGSNPKTDQIIEDKNALKRAAKSIASQIPVESVGEIIADMNAMMERVNAKLETEGIQDEKRKNGKPGGAAKNASGPGTS